MIIILHARAVKYLMLHHKVYVWVNMSNQSSSDLKGTVLELITKNLRQLVLDVTILEAVLENHSIENVELVYFQKIRRRAVDCCRTIMGNLEVLPDPLYIKKEPE